MARWRWVAATALVAAVAPAGAFAGSVIVDWGAFDALGPAPAATATIVLHRPPQPRVAMATPPAAEPTPAAAPKPPAPSTPITATIAPPPPLRPAPVVTPALAPPPPANRVNEVRFAQGSAELPVEAHGVLDGIAATLTANAGLRLQLAGYASAGGNDAIGARRIALKRAIEARSYLIAKGVQTVRMDVRALGDKNDGAGPADRVDLVIVGR